MVTNLKLNWQMEDISPRLHLFTGSYQLSKYIELALFYHILSYVLPLAKLLMNCVRINTFVIYRQTVWL